MAPDTLSVDNFSEAELNQWISKYGWTRQEDGQIFIANQEHIVKTKKINEKIAFDCKWRGVESYKIFLYAFSVSGSLLTYLVSLPDSWYSVQ